jgi:hypothetical protein
VIPLNLILLAGLKRALYNNLRLSNVEQYELSGVVLYLSGI